SKKTWDGLSKQDQELIRKFSREAQLEERKLWQEYEEQAMAKAKAAGIQVIGVADKAPFQAAVKPVSDKYGPPFPQMTTRIQAVHSPPRPVGGSARRPAPRPHAPWSLHGRPLSPRDGRSLLPVRVHRRNRPGPDLRGHPLGRLHALRSQ